MIDADPFELISYEGIPDGFSDTFDDGVAWLAEQIDAAHTVSPDEVRGVGKWISLDYSDEAYGNMYKCAKCGCSEIGEPNYCPNCGSRMMQVTRMRKTNGDVFRSMTNAEIAEFMLSFVDCTTCPIRKLDCEVNGCEKTWIEHLESEVSEDA